MKLSIITINRNNAEGLCATLGSTFHAQPDFSDWEQIVVDGASTDNSVSKITPYRGSPHLGWCVSEPDTGIYNAMNKGAAHAHGDYLLFLNSGDMLLPNVLAKVFREPLNADIAYGDIIVMRHDGESQWSYPPSNEIKPAYFLLGSLPHPASFVLHSFFSKFGGYDESFNIVSDAKFFLDASLAGATFTKLDFPISRFLWGGVSSSAETGAAHRLEREQLLESVFGRATARLAGWTTENRQWIHEATADVARRDLDFAAALLRVSDLCGALWRTRFGRILLRGFANVLEKREKRKLGRQP